MNTYFDAKLNRTLKIFGFFKGSYPQMDALGFSEDFTCYQVGENILPKELILCYLKRLITLGNMRMETALMSNIFTGQPIMIQTLENYAVVSKGRVIDGGFCFPIDFIHYYMYYGIVVPKEYERYIMEILGLRDLETEVFTKILGDMREDYSIVENLVNNKLKRDVALHEHHDHHHD